ncbi:unnamed protein product [Urochloa humidicola]
MSSFVQQKEIKESSGGSIKSFLDRLNSLAEEESDEDEEAEQEDGLVGWVRKGLVRVTVDEPASPLDILTVSLHLPATPTEIAGHLEGVTVVGADRQFLVLSTGPELDDFASSGHYLVYDTKEEKLHLLPPINLGEFREDFGRVPVITATAAGGDSTNNFLLALVLFSRYTEKHSLFTFTSGNNDHWIRKELCGLPKDVTEYAFNTDVAFSIHGSIACWADLTLGIILCDLHSDRDNPCVRFVPLPEDYQINSCFRMSRGRPNVYCTVGFVDGSIRLVYMDGYNDEECPRDKVTISTWSYKGGFDGNEPEKGEWVRDHGAPLRVTDLWADTSFQAIPGVPKRPPMCPVLSHSDPDVVFFFTSDIGYVDGHIDTRGEHALCLNMRSKKVQAWKKCPPGRSFMLIPFLIGIELSVEPRVF